MDCTLFVGRCLGLFLVAVFLDALGFILFVVGVFAPLTVWDFLIFTGPLLIFFSLLFWILWYLGNIEVPVEELLPRRRVVEVVVPSGRTSNRPVAAAYLPLKEYRTEL